MNKLLIVGLLSASFFSVHAENTNEFIDNIDEMLDESPQVETNFTTQASCGQFASVGGGSLVAQNLGLKGFGFTQDVLYWPKGCQTRIDLNAMTFQVNVNKAKCPYIGVAWNRSNKFKIAPVRWSTGQLMSNGATTNQYILKNPGGWIMLVLGYEGAPLPAATAIAASCGNTANDAAAKALRIAKAY